MLKVLVSWEYRTYRYAAARTASVLLYLEWIIGVVRGDEERHQPRGGSENERDERGVGGCSVLC
jgi:hypothetical protein